jgi:hypothetical protein
MGKPKVTPKKMTPTEEKFDFYPPIPGASVQLRGRAERVRPDGGREGRIQFQIAHATGEISGVKFDVTAGIDCAMEVTFLRGKKKDGDGDYYAHTYYVSPEDVVRAAFEIDKQRMKGGK